MSAEIPMSKAEVSHIQSSEAKAGTGTQPECLTSRAQSAVDKSDDHQGKVSVSKEDASHIKYVEMKAGHDTTGEGSLVSTVQSAADKAAEAEKKEDSGDKQEASIPMTKEEASHIKSAETKAGEDTGKGSLAARAQSVTDKSAYKGEEQAEVHVSKDDATHIQDLESKDTGAKREKEQGASLAVKAKEFTEKIAEKVQETTSSGAGQKKSSGQKESSAGQKE